MTELEIIGKATDAAILSFNKILTDNNIDSTKYKITYVKIV